MIPNPLTHRVAPPNTVDQRKVGSVINLAFDSTGSGQSNVVYYKVTYKKVKVTPVQLLAAMLGGEDL
jgi:hypothetical protein